MKKTLIMLLCAVVAALALTACSGNSKPQRLILKELPRTFYYLGESEQAFYDSLESGSVIIRHANNTDTQLSMADENLVMSGFTTESVGVRHVIVTHKQYENLELRFSYTVVDIEPVSFQITKNPTKTTYPIDVKAADIDLAGIEIQTTNNNGTKNAVQTNATFTIVLIDVLSHTEALVTIRLEGTSMTEKFTITLTEE